MPKPIGNLTANLKSKDKVSQRISARFETKSSLAALTHPTQSAKPAAARKVKYKTRKK